MSTSEQFFWGLLLLIVLLAAAFGLRLWVRFAHRDAAERRAARARSGAEPPPGDR